MNQAQNMKVVNYCPPTAIKDNASFTTSANPETGTTSALPTADNDNGVFAFFINLSGRKRYIDVVATAGDGSTGTFGSGVAFLYDGDGINTAAERGLVANLIK
jgi:hypothetical protein